MMRKNMMKRGGMMSGMMRGRMGFGPWQELGEDWYCPRCGGLYYEFPPKEMIEEAMNKALKE